MRGSAVFRTGIAPGGALAGPWVRNPLWTRARAVPSLDLRFADNKSLVDAVTGASLVTFTRASSGTFVGSNGVLQNAVTNLLLRSEEFTDASWQLFGTTSRTANTTVAPNGTITADSVTLPASSGIFQIVNGLANTAYTFSIWIRCDTTQSVRLVINTNLSDPTTLTVTATSTWQRFNITKTTSVGTTTVTSQVDTGGGNTFFLWGAQLEQSTTVGEYVPTTSAINSAPRFDHNPTTGESLGLLVEEARTNSIRNNTMVGAVAGTPGTLPTNWSVFTTLTGLTRQIVGTGTEDGITYIDVRLNGTPNTAGSYFLQTETNTSVVASNGQTWTSSAYVRLAAGSLSGVSSVRLSTSNRDSLGNVIASGDTIFTPTSAALNAQRFANTYTNVSALTAFELLNFAFALSGTAVDFTLRIGLPQLELGAFATSVIPTTTAAATRSADVASITGTAFSGWYRQDEGSFFCSTFAPKGTVVYGTGDTFDNTQYVTVNASNNVTIRFGGADSAVLTAPVSTTGTTNIAHGYAANNFAAVSNGGIVSTDSSGAVPLAQVRLKLGSSAWSPNAGNDINGTIRRLSFWPTRLSNEVLQRITQP